MTIRMVVLLSLSLSILVKIRIWNVDLGLDIRILGVDLVESIDKRIDIWPYNYNQSIELDESFPNHYSSSRHDQERRRYRRKGGLDDTS